MSRRWHVCIALALIAVAPATGRVVAQTVQAQPLVASTDNSQALTLEQALRRALETNPTLRSQRQAHNVAAADIVIARTYPFNPSWENRIQQASGPASAGITNAVPVEELVLLELEIRGQGKYRREVASAALSRTDWTIAAQEQALAVAVVRAFDALLYQQEKVRLLERVLVLDQQLVTDVSRLFQARTVEVMLAQTEVDNARAALAIGRANVITAQATLRTALGAVGKNFTATGTLDLPPQTLDLAALTQQALERRPDLRALQSALAEADATLQLTIADRFGNPVIGPAFTYDPTRVSSIGAQINIPLPVLNTHRGAILKQQAMRCQALLNLQQTQLTVRQEVEAAVEHLRAAQTRATMYRTSILPHLEQVLQDVHKLYLENAKGADLLKIVDVQRSLGTAQAAYLDTLYEASQARAELFAATGGMPVVPSVVEPSETPEVLPPIAPNHAR
ncbi:MAG TPA: TolC family protein [Gemmataceae bacterium]|nr:TolC family protein [Gemmataceae bacterium]